MNWISLKEQQPAVGQRCLVWEPTYQAATFAYWCRPGGFVEMTNGRDRVLGSQEGLYWMPEPTAPPATTDDHGAAGRPGGESR